MAQEDEDLVTSVRAGDRRALARLISAIERGDPGALNAVGPLLGRERPAVVGVTGPPGAGKSTLVGRLARVWAERGRTAVLLVDPSSPLTGGAVLGDRVRMEGETGPVFVRSLATRGHPGGLTERMALVIAALGAAGTATVIVETVGAGQSECDIATLADVTLLLCPPGLGDGIQAIKAGTMEVADVLVVSKSDRPGADRTRQELARTEAHRLDPRPVVGVSVQTGEGLDALVELTTVALEPGAGGRRAGPDIGPVLRARALRYVDAWLDGEDAQHRLATLSEAVRGGRIDLEDAARRLVSGLVPGGEGSDRPAVGGPG